jgi:diguanylate cyclase (GGDEF)-like protein
MPTKGDAGNRRLVAPSLSQANRHTPLDPRSILTSIGEVVYDWDLASDALTWGANGAEVFRLPDLGLFSTGKAFEAAVEPRSGPTRATVLDAKRTDEGTGVPYAARYSIRVGDRVVAIEDTGRWFAGPDGRPAFAHGVVRVSRAAASDETGLGQGLRKRLDFLADIGPDVAAARTAARAVTIIVAAIDDLGRLNEDLGYEAAEAVVQEVRARIAQVMRRRDRHVWYAGNRFALALLSCPRDQAELATTRLIQSVEGSPIKTARGPCIVRLRIGAATAPDHAADAPALLCRAEDALARARRGFARPVVMYDAAESREAARTSGPASSLDLVDALNDRRIRLARQPVVDAHTRAPAFHEALVRIHGPDGLVFAAGEFLPRVERAGLVPLLDARVLELAADYLAANPNERLSVNVSPTTMENTDWLGTLAGHLGARPGIESRLIVEVIETAAIRDPAGVRARLDAMKALGVGIAIDDFGAGHTSFKLLRSFPVDILKIDGAFVQNLARSPEDRFFVRTLLDLAHHLGIATVAEWVEDEDSARLLTQWGVDYLQGNHCGAPVLIQDAPSLAAVEVA